MMKIYYVGIRSLDVQTAYEVKSLAKEIAMRVGATNDPRHADQEMRVQTKEVEKMESLDAIYFPLEKGEKCLEIKLFFKYGPFFLWNKPAEEYLESIGFKAFTHGYVKYFPRHKG